MIDAVITYVNMSDPKWYKIYSENEPVCDKKRTMQYFGDYGTLKYVLRGIDKYASFIDNVYLVVMMESQVPDYINTEKVKIVYHKDIIPEKFLPTFNASTIEMFLHRIKDLKNHFLFFNDDTLLINACQEEDFFKDGKPCLSFSNYIRHGVYRFMNFMAYGENGTKIIRNALGIKGNEEESLLLNHMCNPMVKATCEWVWQNLEREIVFRIEPFRTTFNLNQYVFLYPHYFNNDFVPSELRSCYLTTNSKHELIEEVINSKIFQATCINDNVATDEDYDFIENVLSKKFPDKSKFEK